MLNIGSESWRLRLAWFFAALAPWTLGLILIMTFAAEAGQEPSNLSALAANHFISSAAMIDVGRASSPFDHLQDGQQRQPLILASLESVLPTAVSQQQPEAGAEPTLIFKTWVGTRTSAQIVWPRQNSSARADALIKLRPAMVGAQSGAGQGSVSANAIQTNSGGEADKSAMLTQKGATPKVPRSEVLASATPVELDAVPSPVTAADLAPKAAQTTVVAGSTQQSAGRPDFAALIPPQQARAQENCLAQAIYFEARSESDKGEAAVAQVVLNRVRSGLYPHSVCGVVFQNYRHRDACQFSFACNGHRLVVRDAAAWQRAVAIAHAVTNGNTYVAKVGDATHYHANYVHPRWAHHMRRMDVIGHHIFYASVTGRS